MRWRKLIVGFADHLVAAFQSIVEAAGGIDPGVTARFVLDPELDVLQEIEQLAHRPNRPQLSRPVLAREFGRQFFHPGTVCRVQAAGTSEPRTAQRGKAATELRGAFGKYRRLKPKSYA